MLIWFSGCDYRQACQYCVHSVVQKWVFASSAETTDQIKKVRGYKNGTELLYHRAKYGGDCGSRAGCRRKSVMFLSVFYQALEIGMAKFVTTETL